LLDVRKGEPVLAEPLFADDKRLETLQAGYLPVDVEHLRLEEGGAVAGDDRFAHRGQSARDRRLCNRELPLRCRMIAPSETPEDRELAWLGDAALALVAREWILETKGGLDGEIHRVITSNKFLRAFGHPTKVEAELGALFKKEGIEGVRNRFLTKFLPKFRELHG